MLPYEGSICELSLTYNDWYWLTSLFSRLYTNLSHGCSKRNKGYLTSLTTWFLNICVANGLGPSSSLSRCPCMKSHPWKRFFYERFWTFRETVFRRCFTRRRTLFHPTRPLMSPIGTGGVSPSAIQFLGSLAMMMAFLEGIEGTNYPTMLSPKGWALCRFQFWTAICLLALA